MKHLFDVDIAKLYGVNAAAILENFWHWIRHNEANGTNFYDGYYWTFNSRKALRELFPYLSEKQINTALKKLIDDGIIITGNYNKVAYDRTLWYAITEKGKSMLLLGKIENDKRDVSILPKGKMEDAKRENGIDLEGKPIPDINTDNIPNVNSDNKHIEKESADTLPSTNTKTKKTKSTDDYSIFEEFAGSNVKLLEALKDFLEMRKMIKKPMTERAMTKLIKELQKLSDNADVWIEILEQSILNNWQGVFPLKDNKGGVNGGSTTTNSTQSGGSEWSRFEHDKFCI